MNKKKDHLFHLIKSLSKSEKRYFTLDAQKSGRKESRYLELFRAINQQDEYNEQVLKRKFGKKLGDDKSRLYEAILRSMRDYQSHKSYKARIKELLTDAKLLFERKLYEQAENRLSEAKDLALDLQDHLSVLEINLSQRQLIKGYLGKAYQEQVESLIKEKEKHLSYLQQELWLQDNYDRLSIDFLRFPQKLEEDQIRELEATYSEILKVETETLNSLNAYWRFHEFRALFNRLSGKSGENFSLYYGIVQQFNKHPKIQSEFFINYLGIFSNVLSATSRNQEEFHKLPQLLAELKEKKAPNIQSEKLLFERTAVYELVFLLNSPTAGIENAIKNIDSGLQQYEITPSAKISILFNTILLLFINDRYDDCLEKIEALWKLSKKNKATRQDLNDASRIIYLLAIYKQDIFDHIENSLRAMTRYFAKTSSSPLITFYKIIASTIQNLQKKASTREEKEILHHLKTKIKDEETINYFGLDDITLWWVESYLQNKSIQQIRKETV